MRYSTDDFEASKFLGNAVGKTNPFMRKIACMGNEMREIAGYLEALDIALTLKTTPPTKEQKKKLQTVSKIVVALGQSTFNMDIVSHLSMKATVDEGCADAH